MTNGRLFEILYLLMEKRAATAEQLAQRFEVSVRTIYRDLDALSAAGIPIYTQRGPGGGVRLMDQFILDRTLLSPQEQDEILTALQGLLSAQALESSQTLTRLSSLFRRDRADWLDLDFTDWGNSDVQGEEQRDIFRLLKEGILARRVVSFTYYAASGVCTRRRVEPMRLRFKGGNWYLHGYCLTRGDYRLFRLNRMEDLRLEPETFELRGELPDSMEPPAAEATSLVELELRFSPQATSRVRDSFHPRLVVPQEDGSLLVRVSFPGDQWMMGFLLSFGAQVEVLSPGWVRDLLREESEKIQNLYKT